jgi:exosortase/archaeosortase family protein
MKKFQSMILRYVILVAVAIPNLYLFYLVFTPLTVYLSYFLLDIFFEATLSGKSILVSNRFEIQLINACIAGAAYYLLFVLNLSTPKIKQRYRIIIYSFAMFFSLNIIRIFVLSLMYISSSTIFDVTHKIFWYAGSTIFVVGIWFINVKIFKIREIPFYSDFKYLQKQIWKS